VKQVAAESPGARKKRGGRAPRCRASRAVQWNNFTGVWYAPWCSSRTALICTWS